MPLINESLNILSKGGQVVMISVPHADIIELNYRELFMRQASLHTSYRYANTYEAAIRLIKAKAIPIQKIITQSFPVEKGQEAFDLALSREKPVIKIVVTF